MSCRKEGKEGLQVHIHIVVGLLCCGEQQPPTQSLLERLLLFIPRHDVKDSDSPLSFSPQFLNLRSISQTLYTKLVSHLNCSEQPWLRPLQCQVPFPALDSLTSCHAQSPLPFTSPRHSDSGLMPLSITMLCYPVRKMAGFLFCPSSYQSSQLLLSHDCFLFPKWKDLLVIFLSKGNDPYQPFP